MAIKLAETDPDWTYSEKNARSGLNAPPGICKFAMRTYAF